MKKLAIHLALLGLTLIFISCESTIKLSDHIDKTKSFTLTINQLDEKTGVTQSTNTEIKITSDKHEKLIKWIEDNVDGWSSLEGSYMSNILVSQGDFRLLYYPGSVVLSFLDKEAQGRQYRKEIKTGELDFLVDN